MAEIFTLSSDDVAFLRDFIQKTQRVVKAPRGRAGGVQDDQTASEAYIARTPSGGIPACLNAIPGSAQCFVYQLSESNDVPPIHSLEATDQELTVYNISTCVIPGGVWIGIKRDKYGTWFISSKVELCSLTVGTGTGTGTGTSDVDAGDLIILPAESVVTFNETDPRCESGYLNVYVRVITLTLSISGYLTKSVGAWAFSHRAGCCDCTDLPESTTGTGTSEPRYWWCMTEPGTATATSSELVTGCTLCPFGIPEVLTFKVISGCNDAIDSQAFIYQSFGPMGAGWYTFPEDVGGIELQWFMPCTYESQEDYVSISQLINGIESASASSPVEVCSPFDSGQFAVPTNTPCDPVTIVQVVDES